MITLRLVPQKRTGATIRSAGNGKRVKDGSMRMFRPKRKSQASNLLSVISYLQEQDGGSQSPEGNLGCCVVAVLSDDKQHY
jgi:hypothetical protein